MRLIDSVIIFVSNKPTGLSNINETSIIVYSINDTELMRAASNLEKLLPAKLKDENLVQRCINQRILRTNIYLESAKLTASISQLV